MTEFRYRRGPESVLQDSTDYSLQSTIKQVLYLAASRAGIQGQAGRIPQFALVSAGIGVLWLLLAVSAGSHFRGRAPGDGR